MAMMVVMEDVEVPEEVEVEGVVMIEVHMLVVNMEEAPIVVLVVVVTDVEAPILVVVAVDTYQVMKTITISTLLFFLHRLWGQPRRRYEQCHVIYV